MSSAVETDEVPMQVTAAAVIAAAEALSGGCGNGRGVVLSSGNVCSNEWK